MSIVRIRYIRGVLDVIMLRKNRIEIKERNILDYSMVCYFD